MKKLSLDTANQLATKFRIESGFNTTEPISTKNILRKKNILTIYRPLSNKFYGLSMKSKEDNFFMLINSETTRGRQHFTVAHELYHLFYDDNLMHHICLDTPEYSISEKNADLFAAALLLPHEGILNFLSPDEIKSKNIKLATVLKLEQLYSVSRQSLLYRLKALGLLNESNLQKLLQISVKESAKQYGYDLSLYCTGNNNLIIGDFGEKARILFDTNKISEGHYNELLNLISYDEN